MPTVPIGCPGTTVLTIAITVLPRRSVNGSGSLRDGRVSGQVRNRCRERMAAEGTEMSSVADVKLTARQTRFVQEYLVDLNGTQAAIRAGYSRGSAAVEASRLLRNAKVFDAISRA